MQRGVWTGALLAALLATIGAAIAIQAWSVSWHEPFQYAHLIHDDEQDSTLDLMLIKNIHESGWFNDNTHLNAPFAQHWAEWPMGGDALAYTIKKAIVTATDDVPLTFNLFWFLTFPLAALAAFPVLRALRTSWGASVVGATLFALTPYHFRNGAAHENLAFYVGVPVLVLICVRMLGPDARLQRRRMLFAGTVLIACTGIYYLAFFLSLLAICAILAAIMRREPKRLLYAAMFGGVGIGAAVLTNLPTLLFRWSHATNVLGVPDRPIGVSEAYPLRLVELLSPVTAHLFPPFRLIADKLYEPGLEGYSTVNLGLMAAIGFVAALAVFVWRALRSGNGDRFALEARLGLIVIACLALGSKGGISRVLEFVGLQGVRAWSRIGIVVAFASIAVFARLLDRIRAQRLRRLTPSERRRRRARWAGVCALIIVFGTLDQVSPALTPGGKARNQAWTRDQKFVDALERRVPKNSMVFQLPVVDFPEHGEESHLMAHDLIKEGYLHSTTLRWSAGGVRGREGEWQFPAADLPPLDLLRVLHAIGFRVLTFDRRGYIGGGHTELADFEALLGQPMLSSRGYLFAWDLDRFDGPAPGSAAGHALARAALDAPRLYVASDAEPVVERGGRVHYVCADATMRIIDDGPATRRPLKIDFSRHDSNAHSGELTIDGTRFRRTLKTGSTTTLDVPVRHGITIVRLHLGHYGVRCDAVPTKMLPNFTPTLISQV